MKKTLGQENSIPAFEDFSPSKKKSNFFLITDAKIGTSLGGMEKRTFKLARIEPLRDMIDRDLARTNQAFCLTVASRINSKLD